MPKTLSIRLDDNMKNAADALFCSLGTNTASAVKMFIYTAVKNNRLPSQKEIMANSTQSGNWLFDEVEGKFIRPEIVAEIEESRRNGAYIRMLDGESVDCFLKRAANNV